VLCLSVVLVVQALLFADGGLTALGTNITLMGVVTVAVGWGVTRVVLTLLPRRPSSVPPAATVGALLSVPAAAAVFVVLFGVGGETGLPPGALMVSMLGWHTLIGVGEALITSLTVGAVVAVRPDLVYAARGLRPALRLRQSDGSMVTVPADEPAHATGRNGIRSLLVGGGLAALILGSVVSFLADGAPDGLEYVAGEYGFMQTAQEHLFGGFALADYGDVGRIPVGVAGLLGVLVTVGLAVLVIRAVSRSRRVSSRVAGR
jgi:cobalt/nickel transport system permease protein